MVFLKGRNSLLLQIKGNFSFVGSQGILANSGKCRRLMEGGGGVYRRGQPTVFSTKGIDESRRTTRVGGLNSPIESSKEGTK